MAGSSKQKIYTFLWFDNQAEEAVAFYTGIFDDARVLNTVRYGAAGPGPEGSVMTVAFQLAGQVFLALNGGPLFPFTEAISLVVHCDTQAELDEKWGKLCADGGKPVQCGWLKDKYGLSWQLVPSILPELMSGADQSKVDRVMAAIQSMVKLDIETMKRAAEGA